MDMQEELEIVDAWAKRFDAADEYKKEVDECISQMAYYIALKRGEKLTEKHYSDAVVWASIQLKLERPAANYSAIYALTHDALDFSKACIHELGGIKLRPLQDDFFTILSECCMDKTVAMFFFTKPVKICGVKKMIYDVFKRVYNSGKLNGINGYYIIERIYDADTAGRFIESYEENRERGRAKAISMIKDFI